MKIPRWRTYINWLLGDEISRVTRYFDRTLQWRPHPDDTGLLLSSISTPAKQVISEREQLSEIIVESVTRTALLLNGTLNYSYDVAGLLAGLKPYLARTTRVIIVAYNPYLSIVYRLANFLGIRSGEVPKTFVTRVDLDNLAMLAGFTVVTSRMVGYVPWRLFGVGTALNRVFSTVPVLKWLGLANVLVLKPNATDSDRASRPTLSVVIPARNEEGNIENALLGIPEMGCAREIIFVEGHSSDGTWEEILRVSEKYGSDYTIKVLKQKGTGKSDAVRLGFSMAENDLLTILDADLTMPPDRLASFYNAYVEGHADFINGSRLVYPMEENAMRYLNRLGNIFFAKALSWILGVRIGDSLCGTKMFPRHDYKRMSLWRRDFGDFDPFGDFELLFPAATMALGIVDVPIQYKNRTYGTTNIRRFQDGLKLLRMTIIGFIKIKLGYGCGRSQ